MEEEIGCEKANGFRWDLKELMVPYQWRKDVCEGERKGDRVGGTVTRT